MQNPRPPTHHSEASEEFGHRRGGQNSGLTTFTYNSENGVAVQPGRQTYTAPEGLPLGPADAENSSRPASSASRGAPRSVREEFLSRPRQLVTSTPRLISAVLLDSLWSNSLCEHKAHVVLNSRRCLCSRCSLVEQAFLVAAATRSASGLKPNDADLEAGDVVWHDQTLNGTTQAETLCCGWNLTTSDPFSQQHHSTDETPYLRACGCDWSPHTALATMIALDVLSGGLPCAPVGYLGCGTLICGLQTRWMIRKKYRIVGFGLQDTFIVCCAPQCAVEQQSRELLRQGLEADAPRTWKMA